jgi:hypothetical protein
VTADTLLKVSFAANALNYDADNSGKVIAFCVARRQRCQVRDLVLVPQPGLQADA